jgi:TrmH family RNA methyltransferase
VDFIRLVLVEPLFAGNLGAIARLAGNFNVRDIVLVSPHCSPQDTEALKYAVGSNKAILEQMRIVETLSQALDQCVASVAFAKKDNRPARYFDYVGHARELLEKGAVHSQNKVALVFGKEDHGLSNHEIELCHHETVIHTDAAFVSMNLSHAVAVVLHGLYQMAQPHLSGFQQEFRSQRYNEELDTPATAAELEALVEHLKQTMISAEITSGPNPEQLLRPMAAALRRAHLTKRDLGYFRAFFSKTQNTIQRYRSKD